MDSPFVYPVLILIGSILMIISSAHDIGTGKDEEKFITKNGTNLSVMGGCFGIILFVGSLVWLIGLLIVQIAAK